MTQNNRLKISSTKSKLFTNIAHDEDLAAGFSDLWLSGCYSDFTIVVDDLKEFRVHKAILTIYSPIFAAMFKNEMQEQSTGTMKISKFSTKAVEQFLAYMYTGQMSDASQAIEILALAAMYDVPKLKLCEEIIKSNVDKSNAFEVFSLGHLHSSKFLKEAAVKKMFPGKQLSDELMENPKSIQELILARDVRDEEAQAAKNDLKEAEMEFEEVCRNKNVQNRRPFFLCEQNIFTSINLRASAPRSLFDESFGTVSDEEYFDYQSYSDYYVRSDSDSS